LPAGVGAALLELELTVFAFALPAGVDEGVFAAAVLLEADPAAAPELAAG